MPRYDYLYHVCDYAQVLVAVRFLGGYLRTEKSAEHRVCWSHDLSANKQSSGLELAGHDLGILHKSWCENYIEGILAKEGDFQKKAEKGIRSSLHDAPKALVPDERERDKLVAYYRRQTGRPVIIQGMDLIAEPTRESKEFPYPVEVQTRCVLAPDMYRCFLITPTSRGNLAVKPVATA